jgi:hypothetical protein
MTHFVGILLAWREDAPNSLIAGNDMHQQLIVAICTISHVLSKRFKYVGIGFRKSGIFRLLTLVTAQLDFTNIANLL